MTSAELIAHLKKIDPSGKMTVVEYDGCNHFCDIEARFINIRPMYMEKGRKGMNQYYDEDYRGLEPITVISL